MYRIEGSEIRDEKNGKHVASLTDGTLAFMPGMVAPHKKKLTAHLEGQGVVIRQIVSQAATKTQPPPTGPGAPPPVGNPVPDPVGHKMSELPPFDPSLGFKTPGFEEWRNAHTQEELVAALKKLRAY